MQHPLRTMLEKRQQGSKCGIASICSANELVLEAAMYRAKEQNTPLLIEATANQVNQFGGYTGMLPADFPKLILEIAGRVGLPADQILLGGDHLGPLTWQNLPEEEAMSRSRELVFQYARAGFTKIHLDTSMKVADDPAGLLSTDTIARRGAELYLSAMKGYQELLRENPEALRPVFVIGSEVPIPGGAQEAEEHLSVTTPEALEETLSAYQNAFAAAGVAEGMKDVIAVVVQPGVEFGDDQVFLYNRSKALRLTEGLKSHPEICLEGHSTDYQSKEALREMVEDGIAILKVGPALTYGLREALFSLSMMEKELVPKEQQSGFMEVLESAMLKEPGNWKKALSRR